MEHRKRRCSTPTDSGVANAIEALVRTDLSRLKARIEAIATQQIAPYQNSIQLIRDNARSNFAAHAAETVNSLMTRKGIDEWRTSHVEPLLAEIVSAIQTADASTWGVVSPPLELRRLWQLRVPHALYTTARGILSQLLSDRLKPYDAYFELDTEECDGHNSDSDDETGRPEMVTVGVSIALYRRDGEPPLLSLIKEFSL